MKELPVVVTGARGFVGSHLCRALVRQGRPVVALSRDPDGAASGAAGLRPEALDRLDNLPAAAALVHLAARAHLTDAKARADEAAYHAANVELSRRVARWAVERGVPRIVFASSIAVHGAGVGAIREDSPLVPLDAYGRSKLAAEQAMAGIVRGSDTRLTILRPTVVFGPGNPGNLARLEGLVARGWPLPFARMQNRRSLTSIESLVTWIQAAIDDPAPEDRCFVVADAPPLSTEAIVTAIASARRQRLRLFHLPPGLARVLARLADLPLALLGRPGAASYAVDRLWGSHEVDAAAIVRCFGSASPVDAAALLTQAFAREAA